jgi:hypothetical protein
MRMLLRSMLAVIPLALCATAASAQNPVPVGEATFTLSGRVQAPGRPLVGASVKITNAAGWTKPLTTGTDGQFSLPGLPSGKYDVVASFDGFVEKKTSINLDAHTAAVTIELSPVLPSVPIGEPGGASNVQVERKTVTDDLALQTWLGAQAAAGLRLIQVIPIADKTSLFVFQRVAREPNTIIVSTVPAALDVDGLSARLTQNSTRTFVGVHRLSATSYLLILR